FIVQALQIVRGGREPGLRVRGTQAALDAVAARGFLPDAAVATLRDAYVLLRRIEHRLQYRDDRQTQSIPTTRDELTELARASGETNVGAFVAVLDAHRDAVSTQFDAAFRGEDFETRGSGAGAADRGGSPVSDIAKLGAIWRGDASADSARDALAQG